MTKAVFQGGTKRLLGSCRLLLCCESTSEERSAGNPHATFCGSRRRVTASGDLVTASGDLVTASGDLVAAG
jgi:hypothetical protein